jgi:hypothetical protein
MQLSTQYKVVTGTGTQTYNLTSAAVDRAITAVTFREVDGSGTAKTETLTDTFTGGSINATNWPTTSNATQSGTLILTMTGGGGNAFVADAGTLKFRDSYVLMENTAFPASTATENALFLRRSGDGNERVGFVKINATLFFQNRYDAGASTGVVTDNTSIAYNSTNHRWWKLKETAGKVTYETSPDGTTWTVQRTIGTPLRWGVTDAQTHIDMFDGVAAQTWLPDNYNVPPATGKGPPFSPPRVRRVLLRR